LGFWDFWDFGNFGILEILGFWDFGINLLELIGFSKFFFL